MGLKSGSRDAGLDDDEESETEAEATDPEHREPEHREAVESEPVEKDDEAQTEASTQSSTQSDRPTVASLPYVLRRDKVMEGRDQVPFFLREEVLKGEDELQDTLEETLGENVYKADYREAAMVAAQRNPEIVAEILREWGYDLDQS